MDAFHFLRPLWFLALIPTFWILIVLWRKQSSHTAWQTVFDEQLLEKLWLVTPGQSVRLPLLILVVGWLLVIFVLAGPVWERQPEAVWRAQMSRVLILDLSSSMNLNDVLPSRLERARFKIMDILARSTEGRTGLVVFADEAHVVTPLTEDNATIKNLITALDTRIMPVKGNAGAPALQMASELLKSTDIRQSELLLISDGISDPAAALVLAKRLHAQGNRLSVLGIGTEKSGAVRNNGVSEFVHFNAAPLRALAQAGGGSFALMTIDDSDLNQMLTDVDLTHAFDKVESNSVERWVEYGVWLLPFVLLLTAMAFRRGWLMGFVVLLVTPPPAYAFGWQDLWLRSDQQAQQSLEKGDVKTAAQKFNNPNWRGTALYEEGDYEAAAQAFAESDDIEAKYNLGNALARTGDLQQAIAAYREVLQKKPTHEDAKVNLELLEKLLQQQSKDDASSQKKDEAGDEDSDSDSDSEQPSEETSKENADNSEDSAQQQVKQQENDAQSTEENAENEQADQQSEEQVNPQQADIKDASQQDKNTQPASPDEQQEALASKMSEEDKPLPSEQDIALEQWLRQIPEDPSGLLRRKFMLEHLQRKQSRK